MRERDRLPYSPYKLDRSVRIYSKREWDVPTRNIQTIPEIDEILFDVSFMVGNEVIEMADRNPLRIFHFNMLSRSEFRNNDFERLLQFVCDYIELMLATRKIRDADQDLERNVADAVTLHCIKQVQDYDELNDIIEDERDDRLERAVSTNLPLYRKVLDGIDELHQDDRNGRDSRRDRDYGRSGSRDGRDYWRDRDRDRERSSRRDRDRDSRFSRRDRDNDDRYGAVSARDLPQPGDEDSRRSSVRREYGSDGRSLDKNERSTQTHMPRMSDEVTETRSSRRHASERHYQDRDSANQQEQSDVGIIIPPVLQPPEGKTEMDMLQHAAIYSPDFTGVNLAAAVRTSLSLAEAVASKEVNKDQIDDKVVTSDNLIIASSVQELAHHVSLVSTKSDIESAGENKNGIRYVRNITGLVDNVYKGYPVLKDVRRGIQSSLDKSPSISKLAAAMRGALSVADNAAPDDASASDIRGAIEFIDRILTKEFNAYCELVLGISQGDAIESFMISIDDLTSAIRDGMDEKVFDAFVCFCHEINEVLLAQTYSEYGIEKLIEQRLSNGDMQPDENYMAFPIRYDVTHIPFTMKELGYTIGRNAMVTPMTPFLAAALSTAADKTEDKSSGMLRLVVTRDLSIFRLYDYPGRRDNSKVLVKIS